MSSPYLPIMPISKVISRISLQRVPAKELQGIQQIEDRIYSWPHGLEFKGRHLAQPIPGQAAQILGCLHLQPAWKCFWAGRCRRSSGEGEAVHGLRAQGIALVGAAQVVGSPQAVALLAEDCAQIQWRATGLLGSGAYASVHLARR